MIRKRTTSGLTLQQRYRIYAIHQGKVLGITPLPFDQWRTLKSKQPRE